MKERKIPHKKKNILATIILAEVIVGGLAIHSYYQQKIGQRKILGATKVSKIDKTKIILDQTGELKYYWTLEPNEQWEEQPEWLGYKVSHHVNNDGLRETKNYSIDKPDNTFRIITLGDSFTYGQHVNTDQNWTEVLENKLNKIDCGYDKIEVINLGVGGFDVQYIVKRYQEIGVKYDPDLILWFENDTGFSRFLELMMPFVYECDNNKSIDNEKQKKEIFHYCWSQATKKVDNLYKKNDLNNIIYVNFDKFFQNAPEQKTIIFYYDDEWSSEKKEVINHLNSAHPQATFVGIIPTPIAENTLADGHPSKSGHMVISNSVYTFLLENKLDCQ